MTYLPLKKLGLAALIAGSAQICMVSGTSALALTVATGPAPHIARHDTGVIKVSEKARRHYRNWDEYHRHKGGHRYRHRRDGYTYYHGGYYYASPWWTLSVPLPVIPIPGVSIQIGG